MTCDFGRDAETEPRRNVPRRYPSRADDPSPARRYPLRKPPPERRDFPELTPKTRPWGLCPPTRSLFSPRGRARTPPARETQPYRSHHPRTRRRTPARSRAARASAAGPRAAVCRGPPDRRPAARARPPPRTSPRAPTLPVTGDAPAFRAPNAFVSGFSRGWTGGPTGAPRDPGADCRTRAGRARYPAGTATDGARA